MARRNTAVLIGLLIASMSGQAEIPRDIKLALAARHYTEAVAWLLPSAEAGDPEAAFELGKLYRLGKGVPVDLDAARIWFTVAAEVGSAEAGYLLATVLEDQGRHAEALEWMNRSARAGNRQSQRWLKARLKPSQVTLEQAIRNDVREAGPFSAEELSRVNGHGHTPLMLAVRRKSLYWTGELLNAGADASKQDNLGNSALHYAVASDDAELVKLLVDAGAELNLRSRSGETPLHMAVAAEDIRLVELLLSARARSDIKDGGGWTAKDLAGRSSSGQLRKHFNLPATEISDVDTNANRRIRSAVEAGDLAALDTLLETDIDLTRVNGQGESLLDQAVKSSQLKVVQMLFPLMPARFQQSSLTTAAETANLDILQWLTKQPQLQAIITGTEVPAGLRDGPVVAAVSAACAACVTALINAGADPDRTMNNGESFLVLAARSGHAGVTENLLAAGTSIDRVDDDQRSALWWAAEGGFTDVMTTLLQHGAKQTGDADGLSPLHIAAARNHDSAVRLLISADNLNSETAAGNTALQLAAGRNAAESVTVLLRQDVEVDHRNHNGDTALILATLADAYDVADLLLAAGASASAKNNRFDSAASIVERRNDSRWQELIASNRKPGLLDVFN